MKRDSNTKSTKVLSPAFRKCVCETLYGFVWDLYTRIYDNINVIFYLFYIYLLYFTSCCCRSAIYITTDTQFMKV